MVVAVVIVSDLFLTSHAYLKDGAIQIAGAALVNRFHSRTIGREDGPRKIKTAVASALSQARLSPKDIQILELLGEGLKKDDLNAVHDLKGKPLGEGLGSSDATTGFASLCGLGKLSGGLWREVHF